MANTWTTAVTRALTMWALIAVGMVSGGCQGMMRDRVHCAVHPGVCPVCHAASVDECHCFTGAENGGYCETNWASLYPTVVGHPTMPAVPRQLEELPTPEALLTPESGPAKSSGDELPSPSAVVQAVAHWEFEQEVPARQSRLPVSLRLSDKGHSRSNDATRLSK